MDGWLALKCFEATLNLMLIFIVLGLLKLFPDHFSYFSYVCSSIKMTVYRDIII